MLRRRRPAAAGDYAANDEDDPKKLLAKSTGARIRHIRALAGTLVAAIWSAVSPSPEIRSQEYSEFLTNRVKGLTIGWHIFRTITEGAFLATYGLAFNTVVVQVFWTMSFSSVLMHFFAHSVWLRWREAMCVWTNIAYGTITVLKIFHLVPRLPNENNYMFKHCFLTMADAAFSQTAVHKQYVIQFAEAVIRIIVWRRYNVLPDVPIWGVIAISMVWQVWLLTFASMLQARNVSAFLRQRTAAAAAGSSAAAASANRAANAIPAPAAAPSAAAAAAGGGQQQQQPPVAAPAPAPPPQQQRPPPPPAAPEGLPPIAVRPALVATAANSFTPSTPTAAATKPASAPRLVPRPRRSHDTAWHGQAQVQSGAPSSLGTPQRRRSGGGPGAAQMRYLKALRSVARGPSSYVLLAHQRHQANGQQCASAQFYIPTANPDMLPPNWRERIAIAVAEGAPGWQVANACVRKGSLIVHLDLVYAGVAAAGGEGGTGLALEGAAPAAPSFPSYVFTKPYAGEAADWGSEPSKKVLDDYVGGMDAESLLELLGLSAEDPDGQDPGQGQALGPARLVSVQMGDSIRNLPPSATATATAVACTVAADAAMAVDVDAISQGRPRSVVLAAAAAAGVAGTVTVEPGCEQDTPQKAHREEVTEEGHQQDAATTAAASPLVPVRALSPRPQPQPQPRRALAAALRLAFWPPADLQTPAYAAFLSSRVGTLHLSYAVFMCVTALAFAVVRRSDGVSPLTMSLFLSAELLTLLAHATMGRAAWQVQRAALVYCGVLLRTLQMAACTCGFLPHVLRDSDCESGRWVQKVIIITTLQALCLQPPVRTFFLVRLPSVLMSIYVHVYVCQSNMPLPYATALHLGWEGLLFVVSSVIQCRHVDMFRARHRLHKSAGGSALAAGTPAAAADAETGAGPSTAAAPIYPCPEAADVAATAAATTSPLASSCCSYQRASPFKGVAEAASTELTAAALATDPKATDATITAAAATAGNAADPKATAAAATDWHPAAAPSDPTDVYLSSPLVAMVPRRAARLQLHFNCAPAVVDELQVVLRHINPASMSSGVHAAHAVRDITHALVTPFGAAAAPPYTPAPFTVELTLVASPSDMPGLVHVELWRGRRRVSTSPVLLAAAPDAAAAPPPAAAAASMSLLYDCAARISEAGGAARGNWLDDVLSYVDELRSQGHGGAADQFVEELGGWLAQAAAVERGLTAAGGGGGAGGVAAPRIANVLYFHGYGSDFMYVKPRRVSNVGRDEAVTAAAAGASPPEDPLQGTLRQLLLCQGSMLLAVSVEAGCVALSDYLVGLMVGQLGATLPALLEGARTPVTQLPLLHAAVKSGSAKMVDLVAEWCASSGVKDIWANEVAVMAMSLEPIAGGGSSRGGGGDSLQLGDTGSYGMLNTGSGRRRTRTSLSDKTAGDGEAGGVSPFRSFDHHRCSGDNLTSGGWARIERSREVGAGHAAPFRGSLSEEIPVIGDCDERDLILSDDTPFKIVSFRSSQRNIASGAFATDASAGAGARRGSHDTGPSASPALPHSGGSISSCHRREELDSLVDGGVIVLTPLHLSLALGDEGRLASHILRTYPEAYELWRISQPQPDTDCILGSCIGPSSSEVGASSPARGRSSVEAGNSVILTAATGGDLEVVGRTSTALPPGTDIPAALLHRATAEAFNSAPGLSRLAAGGIERRLQQGGAGGGGGCVGGVLDGGDSMDAASMLSMSLSDVAFLEGIRWVQEESATQKRGGFKVTRL